MDRVPGLAAGLALVLATLALGACGGDSEVERAVKAANAGRYESISCTTDHVIHASGREITAYRCFGSGSELAEAEACVYWENGHLLRRDADFRGIRTESLFCADQG